MDMTKTMSKAINDIELVPVLTEKYSNEHDDNLHNDHDNDEDCDMFDIDIVTEETNSRGSLPVTGIIKKTRKILLILLLVLMTTLIVADRTAIKLSSHSSALVIVPKFKLSSCDDLKQKFGFWSNEQCDLWHLIEQNQTIDMTPFMAENIPQENRFWPTLTGPVGSGQNGRIIYHLHLHKNMGSTFCEWFKKYNKANPSNNCNVPDQWWWNKDPAFHYQSGAYIGTTLQDEQRVYKQIRNRGWIYVASEGSLSDEPIFGDQGPFYHSVVIREPFSWVLSMWHYEYPASKSPISLDDYLTKKIWGVPDFFTRRICGSSCVHTNPLTIDDFLQAKSRLDYFDLVLAYDMVVGDIESTKLIFRNEFPTLRFPEFSSHDHSYTPQPFTSFQTDFIQNITIMDKVLYEYAKILHSEKLKSYEAGS